MRTIERYRRVDHNTIQFNLTIDDPKTYTKTWYAEPRLIKLKPDVEIRNLFAWPPKRRNLPGESASLQPDKSARNDEWSKGAR